MERSVGLDAGRSAFALPGVWPPVEPDQVEPLPISLSAMPFTGGKGCAGYGCMMFTWTSCRRLGVALRP